jgi:cholesterol oxidase
MGWLSVGVESLVARVEKGPAPEYEVIVVGSGYGGAVAACRFAEAGYRVCVLERGREIQAGEFPNDLGLLPGNVRIHRHGEARVIGLPDALFDLRLHRGVTVVLGNALGGGSQVNANVAMRADPQVLQQACWPKEIREGYDLLDAWYTRVEDMLEVAPYPHPCHKGDALERLAAPLSSWLRKEAWQDGDRAPEARFLRPPLAVNHRDGENRFGVTQSACTGCGDCVTGCNVGAKNTLTMNYLPQAKRRGAELYTGATVLAVKPGASGAGATLWFCHSDVDWAGHFAEDRPAGEKDLDKPGVTELSARIVVLAAGSLGSTEILLRSRQLGLLSASPRLGTGFSGNCDALAFIFDQRETVNGAGRGARGAGDPPPGPTIVGTLDVRAGVERRNSVLIQDGALPGALAGIGHELLTSAAMVQQLSAKRLLRSEPHEDPLALCGEALERTQVLLFMGHDEANGTMALERGRVVAMRPDAPAQPAREAALKIAPRAVGGIAFADPLDQPLPAEVDDLLQGSQLGGNAVVVHPLGGCPMGEDLSSGVVDHTGAVFSGETPRSVYDSLYVWDGAAVPASLGVNPFLTIAALAERAAELAIARSGGAWPCTQQDRPLPERPRPRAWQNGGTDKADVCLRETLRGTLYLRDPGGWRPSPAKLQLRMRIADMARFLEDPAHRIGEVSGSMSFPALCGEATVEAGEVTMLERVPSPRIVRMLRGLWTWFMKRGRGELWRALRNRAAGKRSQRKRTRLFRQLLRLASHAGECRQMRYTVHMRVADGTRYRLAGTKMLCYSRHSNPWDALLDLDVTIRRDDGGPVVARGKLRLDLVALADEDLPQVLAAPSSPHALLALGNLTLFFLRVVLRIYFWDFRLPDYRSRLRRAPLERERPLLPDVVRLEGVVVNGERHWIHVPRDMAKPAHLLPLALTRFAPPSPKGFPPLMLMAGFAQSSRAYLAETLEEDLVRHLLRRGFEVWLFDYRTSTALPSSRTQCSLDAVARHDIPAAVDCIRAATGAARIAAMGHCMGSATLAMSLLAGHLDASKVGAAVLSQVPPHIVGGTYSQWRRQLAALLRDVLQVDLINLAADDGASAWEMVMDRFFAAVPVGESPCPDEQRHTHRREDIATCKRVSGIIGPLYRHANVTRTHAVLDRYFGWASLSVFNHIAKFFEYERLVSAEGGNIYVSDDALRRMRLPVLLLHGADNRVFDPESAHRSLEHLQRVNGPERYRLLEPKGYAHFDCLIGDRADRDVYPGIAAFLEEALR